ncbi:hypothetical protein [Nocardia yamanashiensis]|uniref:hypothetical protein n=1 Tax=Nocardia yamanashiensis TaxID=209247 RepID=UPI00082B9267|nr:hypothetical protein [Nocardia yamanashiensis]
MSRCSESGAARRGYVITRHGITLGLSADDSAGFKQIALPKPETPSAGPPGLPGSWGAAPGCFALLDNETHCGTVLFDTGIATMIVGLDPSQRPPALRDAIPNGTPIRTGMPNLTDPALDYSVTIGAPADALAPQGNPAARWSRQGPFVNTGRHLLGGYDYFFDADTGHIGFRENPS